MIIFDLDGTISNCDHRAAKYLALLPKNWDAFYEDCHLDPPIRPVLELLDMLSTSLSDVEIWTGRSETVREKTERWFRHHGVDPTKFRLRMRPKGDFTEDAVMKKQWLDEIRSQNITVTMVFEDRLRVVEMWRAEGILCCHVGGGDF